MDLLEPDDNPLTVHEDVIKYLKEQDLLGGEDEHMPTLTNFTEDNIKQILEQLLQKFERNQKLKEDYEERVKAHNQYHLFNLKDILPDFAIDDEMYDALTFRETLIIQLMVGDNELVPEPVGGLCLDIQRAEGRPPPRRKCTGIETWLSRIMKTKENNDVIRVDEIKTDDKAAAAGDAKDDPGLEDSLDAQAERCVDKFLVHLSSQFGFEDGNAGSSITTWVDRNLHTLEEARKEFFTRKIIKHVETIEKVIRQTSYDVDGKLSKHDDESDKAPKETKNKLIKSISELSQYKVKRQESQKSNVEGRRNSVTMSESSKLTGRSSAKGSQASRKSIIKSRNGTSQQIQTKSAVQESDRSDSIHQKLPAIGTMRLSAQVNITPRISKVDKEFYTKTSEKRVDVAASPKEGEIKEDIIEEMQLVQQSLYVGLLKKYYYIKHLNNENGNIDDRKFYSILKAKDYISEGANFLLQRYLAKTIYIGTFELSTMYINGDMCRNIYRCTGLESQFINDRRIDVCRIYRTIIEECGIEHNSTTILTLQGQIVSQTWEGSHYSLQINPLLDINNYELVSNEKILLKHAWETDMQLMSKYLDEKVANEIKIKSYMIDHPEFRNMITDYIHTILLLKPEDIIDFTISHFLSFAPQFLPQNDYFN